jgi:hypothetical protein
MGLEPTTFCMASETGVDSVTGIPRVGTQTMQTSA